MCFGKYMNTVNNNRNRDFFEDHFDKYPVIQGFSIEQLINNERPRLPQWQPRKDAKIEGGLF